MQSDTNKEPKSPALAGITVGSLFSAGIMTYNAVSHVVGIPIRAYDKSKNKWHEFKSALKSPLNIIISIGAGVVASILAYKSAETENEKLASKEKPEGDELTQNIPATRSNFSRRLQDEKNLQDYQGQDRFR
ncbi:MAG: hypothetical protein QM647_08835 [Asticcacaulis sp.]|uniref:hypothetical protein n=1 Tax=Asticcacaulis sp. TaxID=1872648 RepID=UPI0039E48936